MVRCRSCGAPVPEGAVFCDCGEFVAGHTVAPVVPTPVPASAPVPPTPPPWRPEPVPDVPTPKDPGPVDVESFAWAGATPSATVGVRAQVVLPGGERVELLPGVELMLGRRSPHPVVAAALAPLDTVSRRQAVVVLEGDQVRVTHVGTTNPTYVNGRAVTVPVRVPLPVDVQFGEAVRLSVTRGE